MSFCTVIVHSYISPKPVSIRANSRPAQIRCALSRHAVVHLNKIFWLRKINCICFRTGAVRLTYLRFACQNKHSLLTGGTQHIQWVTCTCKCTHTHALRILSWGKASTGQTWKIMLVNILVVMHRTFASLMTRLSKQYFTCYVLRHAICCAPRDSCYKRTDVYSLWKCMKACVCTST